MPDITVAIDLGGTKIAAAVVDAENNLGPVHRVPTPAADGPEATLDAVAAAVVVVAGGRQVSAVGIGTAGAVDTDGVIVSATRTLPGWTGTDVASGIRARLEPVTGRVVVAVENDVDAHARGEAVQGAAAGGGTAIVVAVGTGVGACVLLDGKPLRGAHHHAGEFGHVPTPGAELLECTCGRAGHLEAIAAGPAIYRRYVDLAGDPQCVDAREVVARAGEGDVVALQVVRDAGEALGRGLAGIATMLDPRVIVVGGGVAVPGGIWWESVERSFRRELVDVLAGIELQIATLGPEAALVGAGVLARRALNKEAAA